jgi:RNA polymerase sigma-54 factor
LDGARWFIDSIRQRHQTLLGTMNAILKFQYRFFEEGDETFLRPMILKDIAEITGLDISTISRVANSKYVQTNFGIFALKYFFSESLSTDSGEEVSTREVKKILSEAIEARNDDSSKIKFKTKMTVKNSVGNQHKFSQQIFKESKRSCSSSEEDKLARSEDKLPRPFLCL